MPDTPYGDASYRLDELGWLQFDRLCELLVEAETGAADLDWRGESDTWRWAIVDEPAAMRSLGALDGLGFFNRDIDLLRSLVTTLPRSAAADGEIWPLVESVLRRVRTLVPSLAERADSAFAIALLAEDAEADRWWVPHDIAEPPSTEPVGAQSHFTPDDVDRVLSDL